MTSVPAVSYTHLDVYKRQLESLSDGKFSFSYPAEDWEVWEQVTTDYHPLTIFYKGTADDGSTSCLLYTSFEAYPEY